MLMIVVMKKIIAAIIACFALYSPLVVPSAHADESVKEDAKELGRDIKRDAKKLGRSVKKHAKKAKVAAKDLGSDIKASAKKTKHKIMD
jgi:hypothetical protein